VEERAAGRIYNVGEPQTPTFAERIADWGRAAGWTGRVIAARDMPEAERMPMDFQHHLVLDTSRIREELRYRERVTRDEGVARTIEWERTAAAPG
jgi:nucleoside-diphosphate-sugar epimerase